LELLSEHDAQLLPVKSRDVTSIIHCVRDASVADIACEHTVSDGVTERLRLPLLGTGLGADTSDELKESRTHLSVRGAETDIVVVTGGLETKLVRGLVLAEQLDGRVDVDGVLKQSFDLGFGVAGCHVCLLGGWVKMISYAYIIP
jgi:hypothetical protein